MKFITPATILALALALDADAGEAGAIDRGCRQQEFEKRNFIVCRFSPAIDDIRLFLNDENGDRHSHFYSIDDALEKNDEALEFAMNAGMYDKNQLPVGLFIENGITLKALNRNEGPGNFHLKPNGVFYVSEVDGSRTASVATSEQYFIAGSKSTVRHATQSGPMLVIDGAIHPRFLPDSDSFKRRNGVGVAESGEVIFALSDSPIRFYDFARLFRDALNTPNALYLDGAISRLYAPELQRNDPGAAMGPVIGVVRKND